MESKLSLIEEVPASVLRVGDCVYIEGEWVVLTKVLRGLTDVGLEWEFDGDPYHIGPDTIVFRKVAEL